MTKRNPESYQPARGNTRQNQLTETFYFSQWNLIINSHQPNGKQKAKKQAYTAKEEKWGQEKANLEEKESLRESEEEEVGLEGMIRELKVTHVCAISPFASLLSRQYLILRTPHKGFSCFTAQDWRNGFLDISSWIVRIRGSVICKF